MLRKSLQLLLAALAIGPALGCATPGSPLPPSLELPKPVQDLRATRQGTVVTLTWTQPTETTDKTRIRLAGPIRICRLIRPAITTPLQNPAAAPLTACSALAPGSEAIWVSALQPAEAASTAAGVCGNSADQAGPQSVKLLPPQKEGARRTAVFCDGLPEDIQRQNPAGEADYAVEVANQRQRSAGLSNTARVALAPAPAPPSDLRAEANKLGVLLTWTPASSPSLGAASLAGYRVERQGADPKRDAELLLVASGSPSNGHFIDTAIEWGKPYSYRVAPVVRVQSPGGETLAEVQGAWSVPAEVTPRDVFPPAQPSGAQAIYTEAGGQHYIDLTWLPNQESDLAGYNVYRRQGDSQPVRINREPVKTPAFRDTDIAPGGTYLYSVSAVDLRGNEGPRSAEASETAPK